MPAPFSYDLRVRFARLIAQGLSARAAARHLNISASTGVRYAQEVAQSGQLRAGRTGGRRGKSKYAPYHAFLHEVLEQDADITLNELKGALRETFDVDIPRSSLSMVIRSLGYTFKKRRWSPPSGISQE